jgi:hypothetical protein
LILNINSVRFICCCSDFLFVMDWFIYDGGLEASLLQLVNHHNQTSLKFREQTEEAKKEALRTATNVLDLLVDSVNGGVQECFANEKRIEFEIRALTATITRYTRQMDKWLAASYAINSVLKEIGCCIDLDQDEILFYRNGVSLGVIFGEIRKTDGA